MINRLLLLGSLVLPAPKTDTVDPPKLPTCSLFLQSYDEHFRKQWAYTKRVSTPFGMFIEGQNHQEKPTEVLAVVQSNITYKGTDERTVRSLGPCAVTHPMAIGLWGKTLYMYVLTYTKNTQGI